MLQRAVFALVSCTLSLSFPQAMLANASTQFVQAPQYTTGNNPQAVAVGDFNGDGKLDLAVGNSASNTVSILLGNGDGTYKIKVDYATGTTPQGIAVGDFNHDGHSDLAVTNSGSSSVSILLGKGDGTFQPKVDYQTVKGSSPRGIAVGDFNGDGFLDIAETNANSPGTVGILLGNGNGTFGAATSYSTANNPYAVAVADVNGDGFLDLVVADNASPGGASVVSVLLGNGKGSFQQYQDSTGANPVAVVVADFNGDGFLDIATANQEGNSVSILLGNGTGNFPTHVEYPTGSFPTGMVAGDFKGDGKIDLAVSAGDGNDVTVLWGAGDGTFSSQINAGTGSTPYSVATGDFNHDGIVDLVAANSGSNSVSVILSNGNGTFQARTDFAAGVQPYAVATADFNGDGILDLAVGNYSANTVSIVFGNGDGSFQNPSTYAAGSPYALATGDLNGDKIPDIVVADYSTGTISVLIGVQGGTFEPAVLYPVGSEPASVMIADFNRDGIPDLAVANFHSNTVGILLGNGDGTFKSAVNYATGNGPVSLAASDFNADGKLDLVVVNESDNDVSVLLGNGDGTFKAQMEYSTGVGGNPLSVVAGDFNGDGIIDLAVANYQTQQVGILLGNGTAGKGNGTFAAVVAYSTSVNPSSIVLADFNGDGKLDLALTSTPLGSSPGNAVSLLLGNGNGTFGSPALFGVGYLSYTAAVGDFNGDGAPDLAVANEGSNTVSVLLNSQGTFMSTSSSMNPSSYGQSVTFTTTVAAGASAGTGPTGTVTVKNGSTVLGSGTLVAGSFAVSTSTLPKGTDTISSTYSGDANYPAHTISINQIVDSASSATALTASPNPSTLNQSVTFTATVTSAASGHATGTVTFLNGTTTIGSSSLSSNGVATLSTSSLSAGTHSITASYSGDGTFSPSTSLPLSQVVQGNASVTLTSSLNPSTVTQSLTLTATVTTSVSSIPTGTVQFMDGATLLGSASTVNASGVATLTLATLSGGTNSVTAVYSGDAKSDPASSGVLSQVVQKANTATVVTASPAAPDLNQEVTLTATVTPSVSLTPTGTVTFMNGTAQLGTGSLNSSGVATFSAPALGAGHYSITANYPGDGNFNGAASPAITLAIAVPDFNLGLGAFSPASIAPGSSATSTITINPINGMIPSAVALSCSVSPATSPAALCAVGTLTVTSGVGNATVTVTTIGPSAAVAAPAQGGSNGFLMLALMVPAMLLGGAGLKTPNGRRLLSFCFVFLALSVCVFEVGCGGSAKGASTTTTTGSAGTPAGSYTVTVSGTGGGVTHTQSISITVQ